MNLGVTRKTLLYTFTSTPKSCTLHRPTQAVRHTLVGSARRSNATDLRSFCQNLRSFCRGLVGSPPRPTWPPPSLSIFPRSLARPSVPSCHLPPPPPTLPDLEPAAGEMWSPRHAGAISLKVRADVSLCILMHNPLPRDRVVSHKRYGLRKRRPMCPASGSRSVARWGGQLPSSPGLAAIAHRGFGAGGLEGQRRTPASG